MTKTITLVMFSLLFICGSISTAGYAYAQISHVSINEQQFILGGYPKFRLNIVSQDANLDKMQFVIRQSGSEERLMVKPINNFLLLVTGVEDVVDPSATLVVREYRVNKWRDVKVFTLFKGQQLSPELAVKSSAAHLSMENQSSKVPSSDKMTSMSQASTQLTAGNNEKSAQYRNALIDESCTLNHTSEMTLWRIGTEHGKEWGIGTYGAMIAIFEANPKAFNQGKISGLRADISLRCPSLALKEKYSNAKMAKQAFEAL
ncbi:hypothetical protein Sps_05364 [Shewanella psychrophila]|uniref:FimV N-terminal domain n=1 Tax=Shewanella psychrophila TaxID=225848 RepID=A0A1S6HY24_9GAMM|nr:hypothetical protein [Shewanella psychrophila]AQS40433.1 hypothetical protein Sps_05364 [Shewanella psychrophila]